MTISKAALAAALVLGVAAAPLAAQLPSRSGQPTTTRQSRANQQQQQQQEQQPAPGGRQYTLSRAEREALQPAIEAVQAAQAACTATPAPAPACATAWTEAQATVPAAQAAARGNDAKYLVGQLQVQIGIGANSIPLQSAGVDAMIASGVAPAEQLGALYNNQARFAADAGDLAKADRALDQLIAMQSTDPLAIARNAQFWVDRNNVAHAMEFYRTHIAAAEAAGHPVTAEVRRLALATAYRAHSPETLAMSRQYLALAPTPQGWHDALLIYRELTPGAATDDRLGLDVYRLMRAAGALTTERDYVEYAELANSGAMYGEVKTVLDAGFARNVIQPANTAATRAMLNAANQRAASDRTSLAGERTSALAGTGGAALRVGDAFYSYGDYAEAAELYRAALQKGGQDANLVNLRLGAALAMAGRRPDAEAAFRAVTGPRAELAQLWLLWLSSPHA